MNPEDAIADALMYAVSALSMAVSQPIAYPGVKYTPVTGQAYLYASLLPNQTRRMFIGNGEPNRHQGILQISVMWPRDVGVMPPLRVAAKIASHLGEGTVLATDLGPIRIDERPSIMPALQGPVWVNVPVRIPYVAFM